MRADQALHIAEHIWDDCVSSSAFFENLLNILPKAEELRIAGKTEDVRPEIEQFRNEMIAMWANTIIDADKHRGIYFNGQQN